MQVIDFKTMELDMDKERETKEIYSADGLKVRIIQLSAGAKIPDCEMASHVIFHILEGDVEITVNQKPVTVNAGKVLVCEPATISMVSINDSKIMGVQIARNDI